MTLSAQVMSGTTTTTTTRAALGFRTHSGWAAVIAIASPSQVAIDVRPTVVGRRRIELIDDKIPEAAQPYHAAAEMGLKEAGECLAKCADRAQLLAREAILSIIDGLTEGNCRAVGCGIVLASGRPLPVLASVLASHALIHTAEGEFFRDVLRRGSEQCNLTVTGVKERELYTRGTRELGMGVEALNRALAEMGRIVGPPWSQDQKSAALAAWLALAASGRSDASTSAVQA
jgi:hypothetical protein